MKAIPTNHPLAIVVVSWLAAGTAEVAAQDSLAAAKALYESAAYAEALVVLDRLQADSRSNEADLPSNHAIEVAEYKAFCLLALGRRDDARPVIEGIVMTDPVRQSGEIQTSPRVQAVFEEVRRRLLPEIIHRSYAEAKATLDRRDFTTAVSQFDRVVALLDDPGSSDLQGRADLRTLAAGFRDLGRMAAEASTSDAARSDRAATAPQAPAPAVASAAGDANVTPPVAVSRVMPPWRPPGPVEARREYRGTLELVIDDQGNVTSVILVKSVHPTYNPALMRAARTWKFKPAMKEGIPVTYLEVMEVFLAPRP